MPTNELMEHAWSAPELSPPPSQSIIKTVTNAAQIAFDAAVENAKQHCGKLVNLMMQVMHGDYVAVVDKLLRPGIPARIDPYSYHVKNDPAMLDWELRGAAA